MMERIEKNEFPHRLAFFRSDTETNWVQTKIVTKIRFVPQSDVVKPNDVFFSFLRNDLTLETYPLLY